MERIFPGRCLRFGGMRRAIGEKAHEVARDVEGRDGAWVHAYLHRKEGDLGNSGYWYQRAGRAMGTGDLKLEWEGIVQEMLER